MAKEAFYFSHDANARTDPKIMAMLLDYKAQGYGLYWAIIEMLSEHDEYKMKKDKITINAIAMAMLCDRNAIEEFVNACVCDYELFASDGIYFWSESLNRRMKLKEEKSQKRSEAGKKGANSRWKNTDLSQDDSNAMANAYQSDDDAMRMDGNKRKEKEINKINKIKYADRVSMTEEEYNKLISEYGEYVTKDKIEALDLWKGSKGKSTKSDYLTIKAWIRNDKKDNKNAPANSNPPRANAGAYKVIE